MYYVPTFHPYPLNAPLYNAEMMSRSNQENGDQLVEVLLAGIKGKATTMDFYNRLAGLAPNQEAYNEIIATQNEERVFLRQFTDMYTALTGMQPVYQIDQARFASYEEGLQKVYEQQVRNYEECHKGYLLTQHLPLRDLFLGACNKEAEHAERFFSFDGRIELKDYGSEPFVLDIEEATTENDTFRTALWTGEHFQVTLMSIDVGDDIGLEIHPNVDQFLRIEQGQGLVQMGDTKNQVNFEEEVFDDYAIMVPAGKWHNVMNTGNLPLKLYAIYAPPEHPFGTVHKTKADALEAEGNS
ncbi:cupin domain-containing protein [Pontibacillus yanchengensis]|uniref:Cupin n=1 Tax=Pontibacillus yanchengensis Y32 TaxID=1385514 RepID=A0A0A2TB51_9BACI|nr:cupin domain-containing protein [Pontibacillus yanchengensis]KGP72764.1 cupin [Pontibacillus yanchengensis Y32]